MAVDRKTAAGKIIEAGLAGSRDGRILAAVAQIGWGIDGLEASIAGSEATPQERAHMARYGVESAINGIVALVTLKMSMRA